MKKAKAMYIPAGGKKAVWGPVDHNVLPEGYPYKEVCETEVQLFQSPSNWVMEANGGDWPTEMTALGIPKEGDVCRVVFEGKEYTATVYLESTIEAPSGIYNNVITVAGGEQTNISTTDTRFIFCFVSAEKVIVKLPGKGRYQEVGEVCVYGPGLTETIHTMAPEFLPELTLTSPNGTKYQLTVADDGTLSAVAQS